MKLAIASLSLLLAACSSPQPSSESSPQPEAAVPAATPAAPAVAEAPMAKRAPDDTTPPMTVFRAFGTEPFWNINVEGDTLTYTTPDDQVGVAMQGTRRALDDGLELSGSHDGKAFVLAVTGGLCNDGMSDNEYELDATFRYGDINYKGCGEVAK
ncbi:hypothetical protein [Thermomonas sp. HDW16]|uniref:COG3650 family protein n=1 Tax=Thermomonas sp. HDW16 TaxID=2714945 RepID=UPI00140BB79C|nr:hypothetical protein [Thermomonas sp. HDW16]QIL21213.1 hypothetical protein G7079_10995 [Thermomonas sp. HDW16]